MPAGYILAIDYGDKKVGLALASSIARLPRPYDTLRNGPNLIQEIRSILKKENVTEVVVGLPRNMDGSLGAQADRCMTFGQAFALETGIPVKFAEEALSSVEAETYLKDLKGKRIGIDAAAAACILERYFSEGGINV